MVESIIWKTKNYRTEIWQGNKKLGSINSYNNKLTQFFANLFNKTVEISLNNERRILNKKSYSKFIKLHPIALTSNRLKSFIEIITEERSNEINFKLRPVTSKFNPKTFVIDNSTIYTFISHLNYHSVLESVLEDEEVKKYTKIVDPIYFYTESDFWEDKKCLRKAFELGQQINEQSAANKTFLLGFYDEKSSLIYLPLEIRAMIIQATNINTLIKQHNYLGDQLGNLFVRFLKGSSFGPFIKRWKDPFLFLQRK